MHRGKADDDQAQVQRAFEDVLAEQGRSRTIEARTRRAEGEWRWLGVYPGLTDAMLDFVAATLHDFCRGARHG